MPYRISVVFHQSCKRFSTSECVIRNRNRTQSFFFNNIFKCVHLSLYEVLSVRRSIRLSVRPYGILGRVHTTLLRHYVGPSVITSRFWRSELKGEQIWVTYPAQMPFFPCPPAHDWCCRVYGLVFGPRKLRGNGIELLERTGYGFMTANNLQITSYQPT